MSGYRRASRVCGARQTSLREPQSLGAATVLGLEHFCSVPERVKCPFQKATERNSAPRGVGKSRHFLGGATLDIAESNRTPDRRKQFQAITLSIRPRGCDSAR